MKLPFPYLTILFAAGLLLSGCENYQEPLSKALDTVPTMSGATYVERSIHGSVSPVGDADPGASLNFHVQASWRDIVSFYEKNLIQNQWWELMRPAYNEHGPVAGRFSFYFKKDTSTEAQVIITPGNQHEADTVEDQEVTIIIKPILFSGVTPEEWYKNAIFIPPNPGSTDMISPAHSDF